MKTVKFPFFLFFVFCLQSLHAQTPGGISTASTLWLKGNYSPSPVKMTFSSGNVVSGWRDEKSTYNLTQATVSKQPLWYDGSSAGSSSDSLNYNPHVKFKYSSTVSNAALLANSNTSTDLLGTAGTVILVLNDDNAFRTALTYYSNTLYRYQIKQTFRSQTSDGIAILSPLANSLSYTSDFSSTPYNSPARNARIVVSRGFGSTLGVRRNASAMGLTNNNVTTFCPGIIAGINLGGNPGVANNEPYDGRFGEVILYSSTLADADIQKIETYLAVKYGITLNHAGLDNTNGYVSSAGTSIYSKGATGTTYWNNIFGLGRDASSGLLQKQSHSYDDSVRIFAGTTLATTNAGNSTAIANDMDFLMMGATTGKLMEAAPTAAEKPSGVTIRMDREWKMINTSFDQVFSIQVKPAAGASSYFTGGGILRLLADDDGDFTNATPINDGTSGVTISYSSLTGIITVTITPSASGGIFPVNGTPKFITIAANNGNLSGNFISFNCNKVNNSVLTTWVTEKEANADYFAVEKSTDLINWQVIDIEKSKAVNGGGAYYQYIDYTPFTPVAYYRIKEVDFNGRIVYSDIVTIKHGQKDIAIQIFPNPATNYMNVSWTGFKKPQQIKISSSYGAVQLVPVTLYDYRAVLDISLLPKGVYTITLISGAEITHTKFCKN
jgi:hypothetical protein